MNIVLILQRRVFLFSLNFYFTLFRGNNAERSDRRQLRLRFLIFYFRYLRQTQICSMLILNNRTEKTKNAK